MSDIYVNGQVATEWLRDHEYTLGLVCDTCGDACEQSGLAEYYRMWDNFNDEGDI